MGFRVWGLGFGVWGLEYRVWGLGFGVSGLGFRVWGLGFGGLGFGVGEFLRVKVQKRQVESQNLVYSNDYSWQVFGGKL